MSQQVVLPKFELPGDRPHWAVRAAWITGGLLLISVIGLGAVIVHHRKLETEAHIAKAEAIARVKAEAEAKIAAIAAVAKARKEAEMEAKLAAQRLPATTLPNSGQSAEASVPTKSAKSTHHSRRVRASHGPKGTKTAAKSKGEGKSTSNKPDAIDELLRKMK